MISMDYAKQKRQNVSNQHFDEGGAQQGVSSDEQRGVSSTQCHFISYLWASSSLVLSQVVMKHFFDYF